MSKRIFYTIVLVSLGVLVYLLTGCSTGGGGDDNSSGEEVAKEAVKWEKVVQLGRPGIDDHNKFAATTYNNGWAIGDGYFWELVDGKWVKDTDYGTSTLDIVALYNNSDNGWALGYNVNEGHDIVWKLSNGVWQDMSATYVSSHMLMSGNEIHVSGCSLTDSNTGWAVVDGGVSDGKILKLENGTWSEYSPNPVTDDYTAVDLVDSLNGWAATDTGKFIKLSSGAWSDSTQTFTGTINTIILSDIDTGFAYGSNVWELNSGSWSGGTGIITNPKKSDNSSYATVTYLGVKNTGTGTYSGWAYCDPDINTADDEELRKLTDNTWDTDYNLPPSFATPVKIINEANGDAWVVCSNGAIWSYDSALDKWSVTTVGGGNSFSNAYSIGSDFIDINNGRVVGYAGELGVNLVLENGNWDFDPSISNSESFSSIKLTDINKGWAGKFTGGTKGFAKLDSGTWVLNDFNTTSWSDRITAIDLVDIDNGWAAGTVDYNDGNTIWHYDTFWKLDNGTWSQAQQFTDTNYKPTFIHLDDIDNGWATARNGAKWVLSGGTWSLSTDRQGRPEADGVFDGYALFYPIDANNGWEAVYDHDTGYGQVWKLVNNTWQSVPDAPIMRIYCWAFQDMDNGWISYGNRIYKVENGIISPYNADENGFETAETYMYDGISHIWLQDYKNGWAIAGNMNIYRLSPNQ